MPRDGNGTYSPPLGSWTTGAMDGADAMIADWLVLLNDLTLAITQSLSKDGQTAMTGNLSMGGKKISNLADAAFSGDAVSLGVLTAMLRLTSSFADKIITYAKIQDITATQRLLGRNTAGAGVTEEVTVSQLLDWMGAAARGQIPFRGSTLWSLLSPGTAGQALTTGGAGADPVYESTMFRAGSYEKATAYTVVAEDRGKVFSCTSSWTMALTAAATLGNGFAFAVDNAGAGTITIDPNGSETIDGSTTLAIGAGKSCIIVCNGTSFNMIGNITDIATSLNASGSAPLYACRAWVNFTGTGTVTIKSSGNVTSITDNGTGDYTVNFTQAFQDANYAAVGMGQRDTPNDSIIVAYKYGVVPATTTSCRFAARGDDNSAHDCKIFSAIFIR